MGNSVQFALVVAVGAIALTASSATWGHFLRPGKNIVWPGDLSIATPASPGRVPLFLLHILKHKLNPHKVQKVTTTPMSHSQCFCVPYYLCDMNNNIITSGIGVIDIRFRPCTGDLEVCCYMPNLNMSTPMPISTATPTLMPMTSMPPTMMPTMPPTTMPTMMPTMPPTMMPTMPPTMMPTMPPATMPTMPPTMMPTMPPATMPTMPPTTMPTMPPTTMPTTLPTMAPAMMSTAPPTMPPTHPPTMMPTMPPTTSATMAPTTMPTAVPTTPPTMTPTMTPATMPTMAPSMMSTMTPTSAPITVFPTPSLSLNCLCVETYQCDASGVIIISGAGVIDPRRQNQRLCPIATQVCCRIPTSVVFPTSMPAMTSMSPAVPSSQLCVCVKTWQCDLMGYVIVSGAGNIDPRFPIGRFGQLGSACSAADETCCKIPANGQDSAVGFPSNGMQPYPSGGLGPIRNPGTDRACICVKTLRCADGFVVSQDGAGIIDPRFGICPMPDDVCCQLQGIVGVKGVGLPSNGRHTLVVTAGGTGSKFDSCGMRSNDYNAGAQRADGPGATLFGEFPWMVALLVRQTKNPLLFQCGGSLLSTRAVLTAAHCVAGQEVGRLVVRVGEWDTRSNNEPLPYQEAGVQTILKHPQFYSGGLYHDVAVLILTSEVNYQTNVRPICLPQQGMAITPGVRCYATGWGRNSFGVEGQYQAVLRQVDLPIVERSDCQNRLRSTRLGQYFQLHGSFMCAGGEPSKDTCTGDGGGPLVCPTSTGRYFQVGVVSWGIGCGSSTTPAVYASVPQHRQWIDQQLANYGVL
ncbi:uncharacterized protein [Neodiprion pinetum]|uniref:uncharacterized protein n=1 Tax=Neodiprion pinetum TaxID=441929 RepID=UPI001EDD5FB2|nr:uncharacterized protein LOC124221238 [Neodiprion pinetum]